MTTFATALVNVLHLTDCDSGGVPAVIDATISSIPGKVIFIGTAPSSFVNRSEIILEIGGRRTKNPMRIISNMLCIVCAVRGLKFNLIHAHSSFGGLYGALLSFMLRVPLVYSSHATPAMIPGKSLIKKALSRLEWLTCRAAVTVIACSEDEASVLRHVCPRATVVVIPNGVDVDSTFNIEPTWDIVAVGRIATQKRADLFSEIVAIVKESMPSVRVAWIGPGPIGPPGVVQWIGEQPETEVIKILSSSKAYLSTSDYEGLSLAALKAACCGCRLFLRDTLGNRAPVALGAQGEIFNTVADGANALIGFLSIQSAWSVEQRYRSSAEGRALFSTPIQMGQLTDLYNRAHEHSWS